MAGADSPVEVSCRGVEAPYVSKVASKGCGSVIVAGDEGGPVLDSCLNEEVTEITSEVTGKVGHCVGEDASSGSDRVVSEPYKDGKH